MLISFDIGIKNLAYCVFANGTSGFAKGTSGTSGFANGISVVDWGIINLSDSTSGLNDVLCNCLVKNGTVCGKKAKYQNEHAHLYCCATHAKSCNKLMPSKELSMPYVKKLKMDDLRLYCAQKFISISVEDKKPVILEKVQQHIEKNVLQPVKKQQSKRQTKYI